MRLSLALLAALAFAPAGPAAAEPFVHASLGPADAALTLATGGRANVTYAWHVEFENTTCPTEPQVGVSFVVEEADVDWGASFVPADNVVRYPGGSGDTTLEVWVSSDRSQPIERTIHLTTDLGLQEIGSGTCTPNPTERNDISTLQLHVEGATGPSGDQGRSKNGGGSPAPPLWPLLFLVPWLRRRA